MSTTTKEPHALHWGWREEDHGGITVWGRVIVAGAVIISEPLRTKPLKDEVKSAALRMREQVAEKLGCDPTRINFITEDMRSSQEPEVKA
jgi:hypothetical protein